MTRVWMRALSCITALALILTTVPLAVSAQDILSEYGFTYTVSDRGYAIIQSCTLQDSVVEIPMYLGYDSLIVGAVAANAFDGCDALETLLLPFSVATIGEDAFADCTRLQTVRYEGDARGWAKIDIAAGNDQLLFAAKECQGWNIVYDDFNSRYAFYPDGTAALIEYCGYDPYFASFPETVYGDYTVTTIASEAFLHSYFCGIAIPRSVTVIEDNAFADCYNLEYVVYEGDPSNIRIGNGNAPLLAADVYANGTTFEEYDGSMYALRPDGTATLLTYNGYAYYELTIPNEVYGHIVTDIHNNALPYLTEITTLYLPGTLTHIGENNFTGCYNLQTIYFSGDEADWQAIQFEAGNEPLMTADIFYDGTTFHSGNGFDYAKLHNDTVMILGCYSYDAIVTIPKTIDGYPVTSIATNAFFENTTTEILNIEADLTLVKKYAFYSAYSLKSVLYHGSEADWSNICIEEGNDCLTYAPRYVNVSDLVTENDMAYLLFDDGTATLLYGTLEFGSVLSIPEFVQGHRVTAVADYAFLNSCSFDGIFIPRSVTYIGDNAFGGCYANWLCYEGDEFEWTSIRFGYGNENLPAYIYHRSLRIIDADGTRYRITTDNTAEVLGGYFNNRLVIPDTISGYPVTAIEFGAFRESYGLTEVVIGNNVTSIRWGAFENCTELTSVTFGEKTYDIYDYAFYGCSSLTDINIENRVCYIGEYAFANTGFTELTIPDHTFVSDYAFSNCCNLMYITVENVSSLSYNTFADSYPFKVFCMEDIYAWNSYAAYSTLGATPCVTNIARLMKQDELYYALRHDGTVAFADAPYTIDDVVIAPTVEGYDVTVIPFGAFYESFRVSSLTIPETVTVIEDWAFYGCTNLTSINLPDNLTCLGENAFGYCESLTEISIPGSVGTIGYDTFSYCSSLASVTISEGITSIGYNAFSSCRSLTSVTLPSTLTYVEMSAFDACGALANVYYNGTLTDWNTITIEERNEPLFTAALHTKAAPGDLDGDNVITTDDTRLILTTILDGDNVLTEDELAAADFNNDGVVNTADIRAILLSIVNSPDDLPL